MSLTQSEAMFDERVHNETHGIATAEIAPTDREVRAEIPSLEELQQRRREIMKDYAPLAAKYKGSRGQGSLADSARKRHRSLIMQKILVELKQAHGKGRRVIPPLCVGHSRSHRKAPLRGWLTRTPSTSSSATR